MVQRFKIPKYIFANARNKVWPQTEPDRVSKPNWGLIDNEDESVAAFAGFISPVFSPDDHRPSSRIPTHTVQMPEMTITHTMVQMHLKRISVNKSGGPDGIHSKLVKILASVVDKPLSFITNLSLQSEKNQMIGDEQWWH